jgi:hypothetical protein
MKRYSNNQPAPYGLYVSARPMDICFVGSEGEEITGREGASYRRLPTWFIALLAPALGGAFVMAFPLLVIATVLGTLAVAAFRALSGSHAYVAQSSWQPAAAYFDGKPTADDATPTAAPELEALEAEVALRADAEKREG